VSERGKVVPRRISGNCARHQRKVQLAVKRARYAAEFAPKSAEKTQFITQLKRLQDTLGHLNDVAVARVLLDQLRKLVQQPPAIASARPFPR